MGFTEEDKWVHPEAYRSELTEIIQGFTLQ